MKDSIKLVITLFLVCGIAAGSLAFVNAATKERIDQYAAIEREEARKLVFPDADSFAESRSYDEWTLERSDEKPGSVFEWQAMRNGTPVGYVFQTSIQGYSGPIKIILGADLKGTLTGVRVLSHTETPGLGAKITTEKFLGQYAGKNVTQMFLKKDDPSKGALDAISAATISSRAVTKAVRDSLATAAAAGTDAASAATEGGK
jgi:electron transport complex protein RnfG